MCCLDVKKEVGFGSVKWTLVDLRLKYVRRRKKGLWPLTEKLKVGRRAIVIQTELMDDRSPVVAKKVSTAWWRFFSCSLRDAVLMTLNVCYTRR